MKIYTIGFTKTGAKEFFETLRENRIEVVMDIRIQNTSQLAAFAKLPDLAYFLEEIIGADYRHETALAPTQQLLKDYRDQNLTWSDYKRKFNRLIRNREIENIRGMKSRFRKQRVALLCSEPTESFCHRRLVVEHLDRKWGNVNGVHLPIRDPDRG